jgi:hypothetical protein
VDECNCDRAIYQDCHELTIGDPQHDDHYAKIRYYTCNPRQVFESGSATCFVERDWWVMGGGGVIPGTANSALDFSGPRTVQGLLRDVNGGTGWSIHANTMFADVHETYVIQANAIGLRFYENGAVVDIRGQLDVFTSQSGIGTEVTQRVTVPSTYYLLGGGFNVVGNPANRPFATDAYAQGMLGGTWNVSGRDMGTGQVYIFARAMGMSQCLHGVRDFCFSGRSITESTSSEGTSVVAATTINAYSGSITVGAGLISSSWWRPIKWLVPYPLASGAPYGFSAAGTTTPINASGTVRGQVMAIRP